MLCDAVRYVTFTFGKLYILELLRCVHLRFLTLRHVMFTLCCFTLCSNIRWLCSVCLAYFQANCLLTSFTNRKRKYIEEKMTATLKRKQTSIATVRYHILPVASLLTSLIFHYPLKVWRRSKPWEVFIFDRPVSSRMVNTVWNCNILFWSKRAQLHLHNCRESQNSTSKSSLTRWNGQKTHLTSLSLYQLLPIVT